MSLTTLRKGYEHTDNKAASITVLLSTEQVI